MSLMIFYLGGAAVAKAIRRLIEFFLLRRGRDASDHHCSNSHHDESDANLWSNTDSEFEANATSAQGSFPSDAFNGSSIPHIHVFVYKPLYIYEFGSTAHRASAPEENIQDEMENLSRSDISAERSKFSNEFQPFDQSKPNYQCASIYRFSNESLNCWLNASLQAVLNLSLVQDIAPNCVTRPITPKLGKLFLTALSNPGRFFSPGELFAVLKELNEAIPYLRLGESNDILDFLQPLLGWLEECGVKTMIQMNEVFQCETCGFTSSDTSHSSIHYLSSPNWGDSISSLLLSSLNECSGHGQCEKCGRVVRKILTVDFPDILTLHLPRTENGQSREPVSPSRVIEVPNSTQRFSLSSVICHNSIRTSDGHYWSYLIKDDVIIQANDDRISVAKNILGMSCDGIIFIYEKCL